MANGRNPGKRDSGRDPGGFVALPWSVLDSSAYLGLSHTSRSLLLEVARQYSIKRDDNGRMLLSGKYLATRGWNSPAVIQRAKRELLEAGLIYETVKGCRPNKASWYAVTWYVLDRIPGYDFGALEGFERGAYRKKDHPKHILKNASVTTSAVVATTPIAISRVVETSTTATPGVAIQVVLTTSPTTPEVHPLRSTISGVHSARSPAAKPTTCQHAGCSTITLGRAFCRKHRPQGSAHAAAQSKLAPSSQ